MQVVRGGKSLWIFTSLLFFPQLWGSLSASTPPPSLPAPVLDIHLRSEESVVLVCRAPEGRSGVTFMLYRFQEKVDSQELQPGAQEVQFTVSVHEGDSGQEGLFCCLYKDQAGRYSAFSPYLHLEHQKDPTRPTPSFPPPVLSVTPPSGVVKHGDMLTFSCSVPTPLQSLSSSDNKPVTFFLLRTTAETGEISFILQPQASRVANSEPQPGHFSVGPIKGGEEGGYTCLYQISKTRRVVNSTVSNMVHISIKDALPKPTLVFQQHTDVWHLVCTGSPAYPGAVFSLYLADQELHVAAQHAPIIQYQVIFPVPVQDTPLTLYQCDYKVLLKGTWRSSERSLSLAVTKGIPPPSSPDVPSVDWPFVLGSFSAVVLFLCSLVLVVVVAHRKVKARAEEKKKRQDAQFWTRVHSRDHVVDLTLRRESFPFQNFEAHHPGRPY
ncbi:uncharacterized protein LOC141784620 isoform X2 [Halichoeres trimaculatus]|uniref:uncharacterized protein LOC141784620 isoform X2 n=1 Tax=Halichoeres trimaculatus TaxID=147232 RepID=UPI003D9F221E